MPKRKPHEREGRCYELAWKFVHEQRMKGDDSWILVHGMIRTSKFPTYPHAWAEHMDGEDTARGIVWEPQENEIWPIRKWYKSVIMVKEAYNVGEAIKLVLRTEHYGPYNWEDREAVGYKEIDQVAYMRQISKILEGK